MLTRIYTRKRQDEEGFTLIELLVVMIIIGILAAIAIPVFLSQQKKAQDTAAKADVSTLGKEIASYFVDNTTAPVITAGNTSGGRYAVSNGTTTFDAGRQSSGVVLYNYSASAAATSLTLTGATAQGWCVMVYDSGGANQYYKYSEANGLETGKCTSYNAT